MATVQQTFQEMEDRENKWAYFKVDQQKYANKTLHYSFWN